MSDEYHEIDETGVVGLLPFSDTEVKKVVRESKVYKKDKILISENVRQKILRAIVLIHNQAKYFEGMAILCNMAGMPNRVLENEYESYEEQARVRNKLNTWVKNLTGNKVKI